MKQLKLILALAILAMMLSGCLFGQRKVEGLPKPMPVSLMESCQPELPYPESGDAEAVTYAYIAAVEMYHECRVGKDGLIDWLKHDQ